MAYEMLVGLQVTDDEKYDAYRLAMKPILITYGGGFNVDLRVSEVLLPTAEPDLNRVFTIYFRDKTAMDNFFTDPEYLKVKQEYFDISVGSMSVLAQYER